MRTTIDLPEALHRQLLAIARDRSRSFSQTVTELLERSLAPGKTSPLTRSEVTGLPVMNIGRVITSEDVRALEDDL
ncbi:MAG TPA: antitoxin [Chloroflexota bacterium]|nr:antitoxin [Chloroflexota bacterium]